MLETEVKADFSLGDIVNAIPRLGIVYGIPQLGLRVPLLSYTVEGEKMRNTPFPGLLPKCPKQLWLS